MAANGGFKRLAKQFFPIYEMIKTNVSRPYNTFLSFHMFEKNINKMFEIFKMRLYVNSVYGLCSLHTFSDGRTDV